MVLFVWGAIVALIGVSGYATKQSVPSLVAGVVAGVLLIGAGALLKSGKGFGFWLGAAITVLLLLRFAPVYFKTQDVWPAGAMAVLSVLALVALLASPAGLNQYRQFRQKLALVAMFMSRRA